MHGGDGERAGSQFAKSQPLTSVAPDRPRGYLLGMESPSGLRQELEAAIADIQRRIAAAHLREGSGFPVNGVWRDKNLAKLRQTLADLEGALSSVSSDDA
jgi:hypothetical protein